MNVSAITLSDPGAKFFESLRAYVARGACLILAACLGACATSPVPPHPIALLRTPDRPIWEFRTEGRQLYALAQNFSYCVDSTGGVISVPAGFVTDFASIPWWGAWALPPNGPYAQAAILHDYLYAIGTHGDEVNRKRADDIFLAAMIEYRVPATARAIVYQSVRWGGANGYGRAGDLQFVDLRTLRRVPPPPRPSSPFVTNIGVNCPHFDEWSNEHDGAPAPIPDLGPHIS